MGHFRATTHEKENDGLPKHWFSLLYSSLYLTAIVAANLLAVKFGPSITILNAFLFIGLDLTSRDNLHELWRDRGLPWRMGLLITMGSTISWWMNRDAGQIAMASLVAFACAGAVDAITYQLLGPYRRIIRVNGSNIFGAAIDSVVFPSLAFGVFLPMVILGQFMAKVMGGFVWSLMFNSWSRTWR